MNMETWEHYIKYLFGLIGIYAVLTITIMYIQAFMGVISSILTIIDNYINLQPYLDYISDILIISLNIVLIVVLTFIVYISGKYIVRPLFLEIYADFNRRNSSDHN